MGVLAKKSRNIVYSILEGQIIISTAHIRSSSEAFKEVWFYETIIWTCENGKKKELIEILEILDSKGEALEQHYDAMVKYTRKIES